MKLVLLAAAGGAVGAGARYLVYLELARWWTAGLAWATLTVNIVGSLLMGILAALLLEKWHDTTGLRVFLMTGVLGGFTTFSAFSFDFVSLVERAEIFRAILYAVASVTLSIAACWVGLALTRASLA